MIIVWFLIIYLAIGLGFCVVTVKNTYGTYLKYHKDIGLAWGWPDTKLMMWACWHALWKWPYLAVLIIRGGPRCEECESHQHHQGE